MNLTGLEREVLLRLKNQDVKFEEFSIVIRCKSNIYCSPLHSRSTLQNASLQDSFSVQICLYRVLQSFSPSTIM